MEIDGPENMGAVGCHLEKNHNIVSSLIQAVILLPIGLWSCLPNCFLESTLSSWCVKHHRLGCSYGIVELIVDTCMLPTLVLL